MRHIPALNVINRPAVLPVVNDGNFRADTGSCHTVQPLKNRAELRHLTEYAGIFMPRVAHHRPVEFFGRTAAFSKLKILNRI